MASPSGLIGIGKRLRAAREASGRTIDDLASATRINKVFLEEMENGRAPKVPEIYLRAFVKAFAMEVGVDPAELLDMLAEPAPAPASPVAEGRAEALASPVSPDRAPSTRGVPEVPADAGRSGPEAVRRQAKILVGLASLVVVGLLMSVYWLRNERNEKGVQEISFSDVVKEQTAKLQPADSSKDTSLIAPRAVKGAGPLAVAKGDSLRLHAATSESVWVHIAVDGAEPTEYTLPPGFQLEWKAAKEFKISLGNPGGIAFTLNGKKLGRLGEGKKPVKNVVLSRATLIGH